MNKEKENKKEHRKGEAKGAHKKKKYIAEYEHEGDPDLKE
jgi:hypothetical protein